MSVLSDLQRAFTLIRQLQGTFGASPPPAARVYNSANIAIATATLTTLTFNSERFDSGDLHSTSTNTSRLTAPITGVYSFGGTVRFADNGTGIRQLALAVNGNQVAATQSAAAAAGFGFDLTVTTLYQLAEGDYAELQAYQTSGGNLNVTAAAPLSPEFWMVRLPS
jgi:hypothetical protein